MWPDNVGQAKSVQRETPRGQRGPLLLQKRLKNNPTNFNIYRADKTGGTGLTRNPTKLEKEERVRRTRKEEMDDITGFL